MNRLKKLRRSHGLKQSELAEVVRVKQNTISNWEKEVTEIDKKSLFLLTDYFGVTTDYLLGKTNIPTATNLNPHNGSTVLPGASKRSGAEELGAKIEKIFIDAWGLDPNEELSDELKERITNLVHTAVALSKRIDDG